jgi:WD40 repeat protein
VTERPRAPEASPADQDRKPTLAAAARAYLDIGDLEPTDVALSPDGRLAAVSAMFSRVEIFDLITGKRLRELGIGDEIPLGMRVEFTPDGAHLVTAGFKLNRVRVWDVATGQELRNFAATGMKRIHSLAVGPEGRVAVGGDGRVELWDYRNGQAGASFQTPLGLPALRIAFDRSGKVLAYATPGGHLGVRREAQGGLVKTGKVEGSEPTALAVSPSGAQVALGQSSGTVRLLDAADLTPVKAFRHGASASIAGLGFSPQGHRLVVLDESGTLQELATADAARLGENRGTQVGTARGLSIAADGRVAAVLGSRRFALLSSREGGLPAGLSRTPPGDPPRPRPTVTLGIPMVQALPAPADRVVSVAIGKEGRTVVLGHYPPAVSLWRYSDRPKPVWTRSWLASIPPAPTGGRAVRLALSPDEQAVYAHGPTDQLRRYRAANGFPLAMMPTQARGLGSLLVTPEPTTLITTTGGEEVLLWAPSGLSKGKLQAMDRPYWAGISADGKLFVEIGSMDDILVVDLATRKTLWRHPSGRYAKREVVALRFDPAAKALYSYHASGFLRRYDARTGKLLGRHRLRLPEGLEGCSLRPDLQVMACATGKELRFIELPSGAELHTVALPGAPAEARLAALDWSPDGAALLVQVGPRHLWMVRLF